MKIRLTLSLALATALGAAVAGQASAHHSFAMFDRSKTVVIDGTVKSMEWVNPHSWLRIMGAASDGKVKSWAIEGPSPNLLVRMGWKLTDVNAGDHVVVTINPLKDGSDGGVIQSIKLASGKTISGDPRP